MSASLSASVLPETAAAAAYGFKEWSLVCAALGEGAQSLILRKGGIHEGRGGFWWRHDRFFLFPTHFHEQETQFPWPASGEIPPPPAEGFHTVRFLATVDFKRQITSWETAAQLQPFHFWSESVIRGRFDYSEETGISLAFLRVYRLDKPWTFPDQRNYGGCRSWLDLPALPADLSWKPVLSDQEHNRRRDVLLEILDSGPESSA